MKVLKSRIFLVIVTAIICITTTIYAENLTSASSIGYKDGTVADALDSLYATQNNVIDNLREGRIVFITESYKKATGWNSSGFNKIIHIEDDYFSYSSNVLTVKKNCNVTIKATLINSGATSSGSIYKLYKNNDVILTVTNTTADGATKVGSITLSLEEGDTLYAQMYGGGNNYTTHLTTFELTNS